MLAVEELPKSPHVFGLDVEEGVLPVEKAQDLGHLQRNENILLAVALGVSQEKALLALEVELMELQWTQSGKFYGFAHRVYLTGNDSRPMSAKYLIYHKKRPPPRLKK